VAQLSPFASSKEMLEGKQLRDATGLLLTCQSLGVGLVRRPNTWSHTKRRRELKERERVLSAFRVPPVHRDPQDSAQPSYRLEGCCGASESSVEKPSFYSKVTKGYDYIVRYGRITKDIT
jgi:hypothetical protein